MSITDYQPRLNTYKDKVDHTKEDQDKIKVHLGKVKPVLNNLTKSKSTIQLMAALIS